MAYWAIIRETPLIDYLRKPLPSELAKRFLGRNLDALEEEVRLTANYHATIMPPETVTVLTKDSTYRDLIPFLLNEERRFVSSDIYLEAEQSDDKARAEEINFLRNVPEPGNKHIAGLNLSEPEQKRILEALKSYKEEVAQRCTLPAFFDILETIARSEIPPRNYKDILNNGPKMLGRIAELSTLRADSFNNRTLPQTPEQVLEEIPELGFILNKKYDPIAEESIVSEVHNTFKPYAQLNPQLCSVHVDAEILVGKLSKDIRIE